jgi:hypothetical protein
MATAVGRGQAGRSVRQPAGSMARRAAGVRGAPAGRGRAHARPPRARRPGSAGRDACRALRGARPARLTARGGGSQGLRGFASRFGELCQELGTAGIADTIQHDDLHRKNLYQRDGRLRVLDWGDSSISHPFASLVATFRFLEQITNLPPDSTWFARLVDAYLEPWGNGLADTFALALRVGTFAHCFAWARQRDYLPEEARSRFDVHFSIVLRRALAQAHFG